MRPAATAGPGLAACRQVPLRLPQWDQPRAALWDGRRGGVSNRPPPEAPPRPRPRPRPPQASMSVDPTASFSGLLGSSLAPANKSAPAGAPPRRSQPVAVRSLDSFAAEHPELGGSLFLVKLDLEGFEAAAIRGMAGLLAARAVPVVQWERNGYWVRAGQVAHSARDEVALFEAAGYAVFLVGERLVAVGGPAWNPLWDVGFEGGLPDHWCLNFLAVLRGSPAHRYALAHQL